MSFTLSSNMDFKNTHHVFKSIVDDFNLEDGQNRGLASQEKVFLPCYILPEDNPKPKILRTLGILNEFVKLTHKEQ